MPDHTTSKLLAAFAESASEYVESVGRDPELHAAIDVAGAGVACAVYRVGAAIVAQQERANELLDRIERKLSAAE
jgi:hypothetical protein